MILGIWLRARANVVAHLLYVKLDCLALAPIHEIHDHERSIIHPRTPVLWMPRGTRRRLASVETRPTNQADHLMILPRLSVETRSRGLGVRLLTRALGRLHCLTGLASSSGSYICVGGMLRNQGCELSCRRLAWTT